MKPRVYDLYCGLGGWAEGFLAEGYDVIGFDIERRPYPGKLVLQDIRTLHGAQLRDAAVIVASSPCQEFSYRAMPWKRAKALGPPVDGINLFCQSIRIQHEASEATGRYIPLVMENVKGAQPWVGRARWHYGSFYLWGDVPALMPHTRGGVMKLGVAHHSNGETNFHGSAARAAIKNNGGSWFAIGSPGQTNVGQNPDGRKINGALRDRQLKPGESGWHKTIMADGTSKSAKRKAASAQIAKIPFPLAQHIARVYKPEPLEATA